MAYTAVGAIGAALWDSGSLPAQVFEIVSNAATLLVVFAWVVWKERRPFSSVGLRGSRPLARFGVGLAIGVLMMAVPVVVLLTTGDYADGRSEHGYPGWSWIWLVILLVLTFTVQSTTEEIVTRGYMLQVAGVQLPGWVALVATSVVFAVAASRLPPLRPAQHHARGDLLQPPRAGSGVAVAGRRHPYGLELGAGQSLRRSGQRHGS
nr:CPBP family intramembrane glutamic endopeptidase [Jiangella endophytica]